MLVLLFASCIAGSTAADTLAARRSAPHTLDPMERQAVGSMVQSLLPMRLADTAVPVPGLTGITPSPTPQPVAPQPRTHTVVAGETLSGIAVQYGLLSGSIALANTDTITDTQLVTVGEVLHIPDQDASGDQFAQLNRQRTKTFASVAYAADLPSAASSSGWAAPVWPASTHNVSQPFSALHTGDDITGDYGSAVVASAAGCVNTAQSGWNGGYGNYVKITHSDGFETLYAHLSTISVKVGQCVSAGEMVGRMGSTGRSTGTHLHYEVRLNDTAVNPMKYMS